MLKFPKVFGSSPTNVPKKFKGAEEERKGEKQKKFFMRFFFIVYYIKKFLKNLNNFLVYE